MKSPDPPARRPTVRHFMVCQQLPIDRLFANLSGRADTSLLL
jgi:hypothetical protein